VNFTQDEKETHEQPNMHTFITGVNMSKKQGEERFQKYQELHTGDIWMNYKALDSQVEEMEKNIQRVVENQEKDFFLAFKNKMYTISKEMKELKEKASSER